MRTPLLFLAACTPTISDTTVVTAPPIQDHDSDTEDTGPTAHSESHDVVVEVHPEVQCVLQIS